MYYMGGNRIFVQRTEGFSRRRLRPQTLFLRPNCSKNLQNSKTFPNCSKITQILPNYSKILQNSKTFPNCSKITKILPNYSKILKNSLKLPKLIQNFQHQCKAVRWKMKTASYKQFYFMNYLCQKTINKFQLPTLTDYCAQCRGYCIQYLNFPHRP